MYQQVTIRFPSPQGEGGAKRRKGGYKHSLTFILFALAFLSIENHALASPSTPPWLPPPTFKKEDYVQIDWDKWLTQTRAPIYQYQVINKYPHSTQSFTEGLFYIKGHLFESTGLYTRSTLQEMELATGKLLQQSKLPAKYFGEGTTALNGKIYQLTYENNKGFVYNLNDFRLIKTFSFTSQGWGLTNDGKQLMMSDGSSNIIFINPASFKINRYILVHDGNQAIGQLNELEYINGKIYANIFNTDMIAIISPVDGKIEGWINMKGLNPDPKIFTAEFILNGIAFRPEKNTLLVTGKCWPYVYEIKIKE